MIRLTHLRAENFKQLRDVSIKFPPRFCALIEGPNEAGKSTLFEAIYFALYGRGLSMSGGGGGQLSSLIAHGSPSATIELGIQANDAHLNIIRPLHRTRNVRPEVCITTPEGEPEVVKGARNVSREILAYINQLDGNTLLSSCFVQQKKLGHIEDLSTDERKELLLKLLNMDRLTRIGNRFKWRADDGRALESARDKFRLCEVTRELVEARAEMERLERHLAMAELRVALEQFKTESEAAQIARQKVEQYEVERGRLAAEIARVEALDETINLLSQIVKARATIAAREGVRKKLLDELERIAKLERDELPCIQSNLDQMNGLMKRVEQIASIEEKRSVMATRAKKLRTVVALAESLIAPKKELQLLIVKCEEAAQRESQARKNYETVKRIEELRRVIAGLEKRASDALERKQWLGQLSEQASSLQRLRQEIVALESERASAREQLNALEEQHHCIERAQALRAWAAARRDVERRSRMEQFIAEIKSKAEAARERQVESSGRERRARSLIYRAVTLIVVGPVAMGVALLVASTLIKLLAIASGLALMATGTWLFASVRRQRDEAALQRQAAERDAVQLERQARDEEVRRAALAGQVPTAMEEARSRLIAAGLSEPASVQAAERFASELSVETDAGLSDKIEKQRQQVQRLDRACDAQQERLRLGEQDLERQLNRAGLESANEMAPAIQATEREYAEAQEQSEVSKEVAAQLAEPVPDGLSSDELYEQWKKASAAKAQIANAATELRARIETQEQSVTAELEAESLTDVEAAKQAIEQLEKDAECTAAGIAEAWQADKQSLLRWQIPLDAAEAKMALVSIRSRLDSQMQQTRTEVEKRAAHEKDLQDVTAEIQSQRSYIERWHQSLIIAVHNAGCPIELVSGGFNPELEVELLQEVQSQRSRDDLGKLKQDAETQIHLKAAEEAKQEQAERNGRHAISLAESLLSRLGVEGLTEPKVERISEQLSGFAEVRSTDQNELQSACNHARAGIIALDKEAARLESELYTKRDDLDYDQCARSLAEIERRKLICDRATPILNNVSENILQAVLPATLDYMRSILPSLTCGRYHDATLDERDKYKIRVWDNRASQYIEKEIFSGATQDQFSLALRLAFALATLPEGLGAQPKFIFLDEPTAGFDGERREALVGLLRDGELSKRFDQIFLATPEGVFNSNPLPHHIRINAGKIVSENISSAAS